MAVKRVDPPGVRSCRGRDGEAGVGGHWRFAQKLEAEGGPRKRMAECVAGLNPYARSALMSELITRMAEGEFGRLHLIRNKGDKGEVKLMTRRRRVLELRFTHQLDPAAGGNRHVRLYFTEPDVEHILLGLLLEWKQDDPMGKSQQNGHIEEADDRIDDHYGD